MARRIHIVPHKQGWAVKREGTKEPLSKHQTQERAQDAGRPIAKRDQTELVTHNRQGQVRDSDSYGRDPLPPKDRKH